MAMAAPEKGCKPPSSPFFRKNGYYPEAKRQEDGHCVCFIHEAIGEKQGDGWPIIHEFHVRAPR